MVCEKQTSAEGATVGGSRKSGFGWLGRRIEKSRLSDREIDSIFDCLLTIVILCVVVSLCLVTFSVKRHVLSIFLIPVFCYILLSSPGFNLRMREYRSLLAITDILVFAELLGLCVFMDRLYYFRADDLILKELLSLIAAAGFIGYLARARIMYYLSVPFIAAVNMLVMYELGCSELEIVSMGLFVVALFAWTLYVNSFYFGYGRAFVDGEFVHLPDDEARYITKMQRVEAKRQREKFMAEMEQRKRSQKQKSR